MIGKYSKLALAGAMLLLVAPADGEANPRRNRGCYRIQVSSDEARTKSRRTPAFSAGEILDLQIQVLLPTQLSGQHQVELKFFTPKGNLYQSMNVPFDADAKGDADAVRGSRGSQRHRRQRYQSVDATLPVAGTSIVTSSLYGTWHVEAYLDGEASACTNAQKFMIQP